MILSQSFYNQPTLKVAQQLLGKFLIRKIGRQKLIGKIVETEAYVGPNDLASHASRGKTLRTETMFGPPGFWYIYFIYGNYFCLNIVTEKNGYPAAVLIRAVESVKGQKIMAKNRGFKNYKPYVICHKLGSGPGKLCQALAINKSLNNMPAFGKNSKLWIEDRGLKIKKSQIVTAKRVGIDYAGSYKNKPWRFYIKNSKFVSKKLSLKNLLL